MPDKRIDETFTPKKCSTCGETIPVRSEAYANFDGHPYRFWHVSCYEKGKDGARDKPKVEEQDDFKEMVLAILGDHSMDLIKIKGLLQEIVEHLWPGEKPNIVPIKAADYMQGRTLLVQDNEGGKK